MLEKRETVSTRKKNHNSQCYQCKYYYAHPFIYLTFWYSGILRCLVYAYKYIDSHTIQEFQVALKTTQYNLLITEV